MRRKEERGITLIALVVTIIVLLILAGVALNATLGENGIIQRSKEAANVHRNAEMDEQTGMNTLAEYMGEYIPKGARPGESGYEGTGWNDPYIPEGYKYKEGTIETGYVITDSTAEDKNGGNEFVWVPIDGTKVKELARREFGGDTYTNMSECSEDEESLATFKASVGAHGGFYIGRYEAGIPEGMEEAISTVSVDARNVPGTPVSKKNAVPWNCISYPQAEANSESFSSNANYPSILVNSYIWDTTLTWIENTEGNGIEIDEINNDSTSWGNYVYSVVTEITKYSIDGGAIWKEDRTETQSGQNMLLLTGNSEYTKANNIYDLAGNLFEWTTENHSSDRVLRGGGFFGDGTDYPSSYRSYGTPAPEAAGDLFGFRFALYKS